MAESKSKKKVNEPTLEEEIQQAEAERKKKISKFHLDMNLDDEFGEYKETPKVADENTEFTDVSSGKPIEDDEESAEIVENVVEGKDEVTAESKQNDEQEQAKTATQPGSFNPFSEESADMEENNDPNAPIRLIDEEEETVKVKKKAGKAEKKATKFMGGLLYIISVVAVSCILACFILAAVLDMLAINKSADQVDVSIPQGASTQEIASILHDNGLISHPLIFRAFSKFTHSDGTYQSGVFTIAPKEGYQGIIQALQSEGERATVDVIVPEGLNVLQIAELLEENNVCKADEFLTTLKNGDFSEYEFIKNVPEIGEGTDYQYRIYRFEGYLFPDTYTFYEQCSAESVIAKFFDNFEVKIDQKLKSAFKAAGMTIDEAITLASIVQKEADNPTDMTKVSRVFQNRLNDLYEFPRLESDVTVKYVENFIPNVSQDSEVFKAYSTYDCEGLPTGPISNPGIDAINAVAYPCTDSDIKNCYYFATDLSSDPTVTYYSETLSEHAYICSKYGIGVYA